jgi:ribonucleoside-triphosphate reductase
MKFRGPLFATVHARTYARSKPDGTKETWDDTVERVVHGNTTLVNTRHIDGDEVTRLTELIGDLHLTPAGRHLWSGGVQGSSHTFNCIVNGWGPHLADHACGLMSGLMVGCGSGSNYSPDLIAALPSLASAAVELIVRVDPSHPDSAEVSQDPHLSGGPAVFQTPDSREGWVDSLQLLLDTAEKDGGPVYIDVSHVRPRGSLIRGFGGTASGPGPLVKMLRNIATLLANAAGRHLSALELMEIDHIISECVIAGNVRRSARLSAMHFRSPEIFSFISCKDDPTKHWSTNISVEVDDAFFEALDNREPHANKVFEAVIGGMLKNGEPGFLNSSLANHGEVGEVRSTNPCGELWLEGDGVSTLEACCIGSINLAAFPARGDTVEPELIEAARLMTRFLLRATFADKFDPRMANVIDKNRRIGVGFTGLTEWYASHGLRWTEARHSRIIDRKLDLIAQAVREEADSYAAQLDCNSPIKTMALAPTGSISLLAGVTPSLQPPFARYFIRRVRYSNDDPELRRMLDNYRHEPDLYSDHTTVVEIPMADAILDRYPDHLIQQSDEISVDDFLGTQAFLQRHIDNAISATVNLQPGVTAIELGSAIQKWLPKLKGVTCFPEVSRPQSPYEPITRDQYNESLSAEVGQGFDEECASGACPVR